MTTTPTLGGTPHRQRRAAALGVTAGLLGGGAIGLLMTVPSLTSAATDDSATGGASAVALQDDGEQPADPAVVDRPEPGERLRAALQELVDGNVITAEQADAVAEHLAELRPDRPHRHHRGHARGSQAVADAIGIDVETLRDELRAGSSVADVAEANGVAVDDVIDALVIEAGERLDRAVENGRLTRDEADERLAEIRERITEGIDDTRPIGR